MPKPTVKVTKLTDLIPDAKNANKGTLRGLAMLEDSIQELGAGRSILVDRNNRVIAGNKTQQAAIDAGLTEAIVVPTDGNQLVIVQRVDIDLDSPRGRKLAILDNRTGEVSLDWNPEELKALLDDGLDLSFGWDDDELAALLAIVPDFKPVAEAETKRLDEKEPIICPHCNKSFIYDGRTKKVIVDA